MTTWRLPPTGSYDIMYRDCADYEKSYNSLYDDGVAVHTCTTCKMLIYGKSDTWRGASWLTRHIYWCDFFCKKLILEPCRTKACIYYEEKENEND